MRAVGLLRRLLRGEAARWAAVAAWVRGRQDGGADGDVALAYAGDGRPLLVAAAVVSVVELVAVEVLVPWPWLRWTLLLLGLWGGGLVLGVLAQREVRPHVLGDDALRLRLGATADVRVPLGRVQRVVARRRDASGLVALADGVLSLAPDAGHTDVEVVLSEPVAVVAGRLAGEVTRVRFSVDAPRAAVDAVRARLDTLDTRARTLPRDG